MILFVTTADTDLLTADRALEDLPADFPEVKAFNPANMSSPASIKASPDGTSSDSPEESEQQAILTAAAEADVVVLRLLGGKRAMPEMFDPLVRICHDRGIPLIACPGHQEWDQELVTACNVPPSELDAIFSYLIRGGVPNFQNLFLFLSDSYLGSDYGHEAPAEVPWEGVYHPEEADGLTAQDFVDRRFQPDRPNIAILFYRAHWMSGNLLTIDSLINRFDELGANVLPVYSFSLKHNPEGDGQGNRTFSEILCDANGKSRVHCIVNTMGMSMTDLQQDGATFATGPQVDYLDQLNVPIIQGIFSTGSESDWDKSELGLGPIDTAMNVALPEFDGRIITVPISFKEEVASAV
ncbi:MAG: cobaltochelatase subunit CobN, partial [bacterium]